MQTLNSRRVIVALLLATLLLGFVIGSVKAPAPVQAGPLAAPTPAAPSVLASKAATARYPVTFWNQKVITQATRSALQDLVNYGLVDIQYVIDQGTTNTVTLVTRHTMFGDGSNMVTGQTVVANNAADASDLNQFYLFGRYTDIYATVANTNPVTITVLGVAK